jgi:hypothetical protein
MRKILLATILLGVVLSIPGRAAAGAVVLGWHRGGAFGFGAPPVVAYPYPYSYPYASYPYYPGYYPGYDFGGSYFRPEAPVGWNAQRNWRDTWQDDGVKLHTYTLH